jgi:hypothetical protein
VRKSIVDVHDLPVTVQLVCCMPEPVKAERKPVMTYTRNSIPDLTGQTAVVTGSNGGLGLETAKALAGGGAHVVMAVRNQEKAAKALDEIRAETPDASLELVELDLGSQESVKRAAAAILAEHDRIDILVNNAGSDDRVRTFFSLSWRPAAPAASGTNPASSSVRLFGFRTVCIQRNLSTSPHCQALIVCSVSPIA